MPKELVPAQNPYELSPPAVPKHKFKCHDCGHVLWFNMTDDPIDENSGCKNCKSFNWDIFDPNGDKIE